jgi:hypothetical protein
MAGRPFVRDVIELLQETLERLETTQQLKPDDPILLQLKQHVVRTIAELEIQQSGKSKAE